MLIMSGVTICKNSIIHAYLYMDKYILDNKIIKKYQNYNPIRYLQHMSKSFIPNLSIIDLLANVGSKSGKLLKENN